MKRRSIIIGIIISVIIIISVAVTLAIVGPNIKVKKKAKTVIIDNELPMIEQEKDDNEDEPLIAFLEKKEEIQEEPKIKDASTLTQDIQEMNIDIGNLKIPKTGLNTEVFCKQDANKMEEVPCMLYTNKGPNQPGITILVGHNRANGTLFSDNEKLEENDEFYFTDYLNGEEKKYTVYSKFVTNNDDVSFYNMQSDSPVIAMQCCLTPTDSNNVLIIMAKAE